MLIAYIFAAPFTVMTSIDAPDADAPRFRLVAIPEEMDTPVEVRAVSAGPEDAAGAGYAPPMSPFRFDAEPKRAAYSAAAE
ncbi:hypothetical protein [Chenggangzhangella methanolivorans]|uniref:hypothetical protein n=1 Tax=Chenggangzhangella methanolivorans TaxID=1437009 RepID=UPI0021BD7301|nr:hypothetical protein [Chenggangzhangella methanolivorans]